MDSKRLAEAAAFAAKAHEGVHRKGTDEPYISHPIEAGLIAMTITVDEDVIVAAFLHDVIEDTNYEYDDIKSRFGERVAKLVAYESEDKMRNIPAEDSWKARKQAFLEHISSAPLDAKIICLCDKVSNLRMSAITHTKKGDDMWRVFNQKDKKEQEWYYRSIAKELTELEATDAYQEYLRLCDEVFA